MNKNRLLIVFILRLVIFGLFILSAITKVYPTILTFEKQLFNLDLVDWCTAPYMARLIIALELFLGLAFLQSNYLRRIIIPLTSLLLVAFCIHLSILIYTQGANSGNCGCFGDAIPMTPLQALIKNIITLGILGYMYVIYKEKEKSKNNILVLAVIYLSANLALFMFFPFAPCNAVKADSELDLEVTVSDSNQGLVKDSLKKDSIVKTPEIKTVTPLTPTIKKDSVIKPVPVVNADALCPVKKVSVYAPYRKFSDGAVVDLDNGRKIITLFSLECEHCMETAKKIGELSRKRGIPGTYFLFWGTEDQVENFFKVAQCRFPYKIIEPTAFFQLLGSAPSPPKVSVLCNGNIVADFDNSSFSVEKLEEALNK